jgi:hypothetical protein
MSEENVEAEVKAEKKAGMLSGLLGKTIVTLSPLMEKVRDIVLGFGELIVTVSVIIGLITALINGFSDMANIGFFAGLGTMFSEAVTVITGALVVFLLFAIYRNGEKPLKKS